MVNARYFIEQNSHETSEDISWAAYYARYQDPGDRIITRTALLPLFQESAQTVAIIKHSMDVVKSPVERLNTGQTPVLTFNQPLYALQIQCKWAKFYGENLFVVMLGGLHYEVAALKTICDWLQGSEWTQALVQANITTVGKADSLSRATQVVPTKRHIKLLLFSLYICNMTNTILLVHKKWDFFEVWYLMRKQCCPQFHYWKTVMQVEVCFSLMFFH